MSPSLALNRSYSLGLVVSIACALICFSAPASAQSYRQQNLVSDLPGLAPTQDTNLVNPWGIVFPPTGPFWIADNGAGVSTLYDSNGNPFPLSSPLIVAIPPPAGGSGSAPTGVVFNGTSDFMVSENSASGPARFIFVTEDGTISGWNPTVDVTNAILEVDNSAPGGPDGFLLGAVYKGLANGNNGSGNFIYATNFSDGAVEMYDASFNFVKSFTDPGITPDAAGTGFAPFGIRNINGNLYVTFAMQDSFRHDDVKGPGNGFIDVFDLNGNFVQRFASGGTLNSPWGLALAPAHFGKFSGDLLVGNFGDGRINGFMPQGHSFVGQLRGPLGQPITIDGLWGLTFGNGHTAGPTNVLFFTAGIFDESHGLFGKIIAPGVKNH
ncbi:MAG: TIGR03118 family protein [Acidobacteria bacterium]|nr:MAG: TIGR03118 family protein [Acidobacteriota bacterium]